MNIWGYEKKIKVAKQKLKLGENRLGTRKYNILSSRVKCWEHCIKKLREKNNKK